MAQLTIDFERAEQLGMVARWECPRVRGVSPAACKAVLRAIDGFGRGREAWPSERTLAQVAGVSERTVKRAIRHLVNLSVLISERRGPHTLNHYRIVWTELALLVPGRTNCARPERSATVSERSATVSERSATVAPKTTSNQKKETTTTQEQPVVVVLLDLGLARAEQAYRTACELFSAEEITERIESFRAREDRNPGVLYNWLTMPGSYRPPAVQTLRLASGLEPAAERKRAELIQYGRAKGWTFQQLQNAVRKFEAEHDATTV